MTKIIMNLILNKTSAGTRHLKIPKSERKKEKNTVMALPHLIDYSLVSLTSY